MFILSVVFVFFFELLSMSNINAFCHCQKSWILSSPTVDQQNTVARVAVYAGHYGAQESIPTGYHEYILICLFIYISIRIRRDRRNAMRQ